MSKTLKPLSDEKLAKATGGDDDGYQDFHTGEVLYNGDSLLGNYNPRGL